MRGYDIAMTAARSTFVCAFLLVLAVACTDEKAEPAPTTPVVTAAPTICATTPATEGRVVRVTIDDVVGGFGRLGLRADSGLTPGIVRIEVSGDIANAMPLGVTILRDGIPVGVVDGVGAGETCGIDLEVAEGTYRVTDGDLSVEFAVGP